MPTASTEYPPLYVESGILRENTMKTLKILAIGDNVADKYLSRGKMYPGGQSFNTAVFAEMNGVESAYLGKFGDDAVAQHNCAVLKMMRVDNSRSRHFKGENGYARVTLQKGDRVFLGSNKGGIAKEHSYDFTAEDLAYLESFDLIYTNLNSYIEADLSFLTGAGRPIAFDFSTRWTDDYFAQVAPYINIGVLSCSHLTAEEREREMEKLYGMGPELVVGTVGEKGSYVLYEGNYYYQSALPVIDIVDTMGAGDAYFTAFICSLLKSTEGRLSNLNAEYIPKAMQAGAAFAAKVCGMEGAFGQGIAIA